MHKVLSLIALIGLSICGLFAHGDTFVATGTMGAIIESADTSTGATGNVVFRVACQDTPLSVEVTDLYFGDIYSSNYKNTVQNGEWLSHEGIQGITVTDLQGGCWEDTDGDGSFRSISLAFSDLEADDGSYTMDIGHDVGYDTGSTIFSRLTMNSQGGNSDQSIHLSQIDGSPNPSIQSFPTDDYTFDNGESVTVLHRDVATDNGSIGIFGFTPSIDLELPTYVPAGRYVGTISVFISQG